MKKRVANRTLVKRDYMDYFESGRTVMCLNNNDGRDCLTVGRKYKSDGELDGEITIKNDGGIMSVYAIGQFVPYFVWREMVRVVTATQKLKTTINRKIKQ